MFIINKNLNKFKILSEASETLKNKDLNPLDYSATEITKNSMYIFRSLSEKEKESEINLSVLKDNSLIENAIFFIQLGEYIHIFKKADNTIKLLDITKIGSEQAEFNLGYLVVYVQEHLDTLSFFYIGNNSIREIITKTVESLGLDANSFINLEVEEGANIEIRPVVVSALETFIDSLPPGLTIKSKNLIKSIPLFKNKIYTSMKKNIILISILFTAILLVAIGTYFHLEKQKQRKIEIEKQRVAMEKRLSTDFLNIENNIKKNIFIHKILDAGIDEVDIVKNNFTLVTNINLLNNINSKFIGTDKLNSITNIGKDSYLMSGLIRGKIKIRSKSKIIKIKKEKLFGLFKKYGTMSTYLKSEFRISNKLTKKELYTVLDIFRNSNTYTYNLYLKGTDVKNIYNVLIYIYKNAKIKKITKLKKKVKK